MTTQHKKIQKLLNLIQDLTELEVDTLFEEVKHIRFDKPSSDCNVATSTIHVNENKVFRLEIYRQLLDDFLKMRGVERESFENTLLAFINYYSEEDYLRLIILPDVLESIPSYVEYPKQLAYNLRKRQKTYPRVEIRYDPSAAHLDVFCHKDVGKKAFKQNRNTFLGAVVDHLTQNGFADIDQSNQLIPRSYITNPAMLKQALISKGFRNIILSLTPSGIRIKADKPIEEILSIT